MRGMKTKGVAGGNVKKGTFKRILKYAFKYYKKYKQEY